MNSFEREAGEAAQHQHLVQTEVPAKLLEEWLGLWAKYHQIAGSLQVRLRPHTAGSELLELTLSEPAGGKVGDIIAADVSEDGVKALLAPDREHLNALIQRKSPYAPVDIAASTP